jgi:hypothetical protein
VSAAGIAATFLLGTGLWLLIGLAIGVAFGKSIALADQKADEQYSADVHAAMQRHPSGRVDIRC